MSHQAETSGSHIKSFKVTHKGKQYQLTEAQLQRYPDSLLAQLAKDTQGGSAKRRRTDNGPSDDAQEHLEPQQEHVLPIPESVKLDVVECALHLYRTGSILTAPLPENFSLRWIADDLIGYFRLPSLSSLVAQQPANQLANMHVASKILRLMNEQSVEQVAAQICHYAVRTEETRLMGTAYFLPKLDNQAKLVQLYALEVTNEVAAKLAEYKVVLDRSSWKLVTSVSPEPAGQSVPGSTLDTFRRLKVFDVALPELLSEQGFHASWSDFYMPRAAGNGHDKWQVLKVDWRDMYDPYD